MKDTYYIQVNKKAWGNLTPTQKRWRIVNTLHSKLIAFHFVCGQEIKEQMFDLMREQKEKQEYDNLRLTIYNIYIEKMNSKENIYSKNVKLKTIKRLLLIAE
jgi:hypothetical protein